MYYYIIMKFKKKLFLIVVLCLAFAVYADENKTKYCMICDYKGNVLYELKQSEIPYLEDLVARSKKKGLAKMRCHYRIKIVNGDKEIVYWTNGILIACGNDIYYELDEDVVKLFLGENLQIEGKLPRIHD